MAVESSIGGAQESSDLHIRKKRVINRTNNGQVPGSLQRAPYIVNIVKDGLSHCAGIILDSDIILTVPSCIKEFVCTAILKISPSIDLHKSHNAKIELFTEVLPANSYAWFSGWGCTSLGPKNPPVFPVNLMMTRLPLISQQECVQAHHGPVYINLRYICTLDASGRRATCIGDEGGPLVYNKRLIGVLLYRTLEIGKRPDVFANLIHPDAQHWINEIINFLQH
ncbi:chymotrypsin-1-like [Belonocnema kinseyi]|uniref:chymotrypsin-1-like n=1 Tax=Belonocnema kinseyi TaxID=2817044 RepID=UPI00143D8142|nr:chymotrypsin-1-like [Belonocnema kinseyi]